MKLDVNLGFQQVQALRDRTTNPIHQRNLDIVIEHMKAEACCDVQRVLDTLVDVPEYRWHSDRANPDLNPKGSKQAVADFYDMWIVQTGAHRLEWDLSRIMVDDHAVLTEGIMKVAFPGKTLLGMGIEVDDPEALYLAEGITTVVWPVDAKTGKLIGEEVYDYDKMIGIADRKIQLSDVAPLVPEAFAA
jgi:hypothetical protein